MELHKPLFKLREIKIEVTHRCSLGCIHCSSDASQTSYLEMSEPDCIRILSEASKLKVHEVAFSGGEPFLWTGVESAVSFATTKGMQAIIYTSGNAPNASELVTKLTKAGADRFVFSIFGASEEAHERITRIRGSFSVTLSILSHAYQAGLKTELHFIPMVQNYRELRSIVKLAENYGVSRISVLRLVPQGRGKLLRGDLLSRIQNLELRRTIEELRKQGYEIRTGSPYNFLMLNKQPKCCSGIDRLIIGPDLSIYPCDAFKQISAEELVGTNHLSSLRENSLEECWEGSPYLNAVRKYLTTPFPRQCGNCRSLEQCLSGCLAQKVIEHGNLQKRPDPMCMIGRGGEKHA
jgi:radical SAM protein with 4Fe4S-binding SPASM domain